MAARWIQQKRIKQARLRKAWAKPFGRKGAKLNPEAGYLNDKGDFVSLSLGQRAKTAGSQEPEINSKLKHKWLARIFMDGYVQNEDGQFVKPGKITPGDLAREQAKELEHLYQTERQQALRKYVCQRLYDEDGYKLYAYICGEEFFFVTQIKLKTKIIRKRSFTYKPNGEQVRNRVYFLAENEEQIEWWTVEEEQITNPTAPATETTEC